MRLLTAAREVFAAHGLAVSLDDVARHAGVGVGTLYRRFPNKDALVDAVFDHALDELFAAVADIAADPDPWRAITRLVEELVRRQSADRGLYEICTKVGLGRMERITAQYVPIVDTLVARARAEGTLRPDVAPSDIAVLVIMVTATAEATRAADPDHWRRYLTLLLDGLRAPGTTPLPVAALTHEELEVAIRDARF
ncbi:AcrR family transcriptional regulator [Actinokineospora auranticolor]|uniref:AcrR family transcriptional regulator n=1 Tax=Actinokineospora auranticolor TaxID=155976 RepID=A0A2S6GBK0_9PSEU|nr:AcrR family transcriptional regulator [Actinokineospora auranticolor]